VILRRSPLAVRHQVEPPVSAPPGGVLLAMCLGLMLSMLNSTLVNVTMPQIGAELHASDSGLQWVADIYTLGYASLLLPGGALGNRIGRRPAFLGGIAVFLLGSLLCMLAPNLAVLLVARFVQAAGVSSMLPQTLAILVHEYAEPAARARAVGVWAGVASLGLAAGPVIGGVITTVSDWRAGFALTAVVAAGTLLLGRRAVPAARHGRPEDAGRVDLLGAALGMVWPAALVFALIEAADLGWTDPPIMACDAVAALGLLAFALSQRSRPHSRPRPLMPLQLWRARGFTVANAAGFCYFFTFFGVLFFYSLDLQRDQHLSALATGALFLPMTLFMAALAPIAGRLAARLGTRTVLGSGLVVTALGCLALAALPGHPAVLDLEWRMALLGAGAGLMSSPMSNAAVSSVPVAHSGTASAVHNTCRQIGSTLGVALLGVLVHGPDFSAGLPAAMLLCAALLLACAVTAFTLLARRAH
jgi:EmrB/QacA subfamily drug resistance transporter